MVFLRDIMPTEHYLENHAKEVPWNEVLLLITMTKNPRRKGDIFEIETEEHYVVFAVRNKVAFVINAKRK
jgi:hypothetical protein